MTWRLAESLVVLRRQINEVWPARSKASDGSIGDPAHQAEGTGSDHNPNRHGVVCALDITHDPANGVDIDKLSDALADSGDPRIKYIIANGEAIEPAKFGWVWQPYGGDNPHTSHLHISVYGNYDDPSPWNIGKEEEEVMRPTEAQVIDAFEQFGLTKPKNKEQINYYTGQGFDVLLRDLRGIVFPTAAEVNEVFTKYLPDASSDPNRISYYTSRNKAQLYKDVMGAVRDRLEKVKKEGDLKSTGEFVPVSETLYKKKN